MRTGKDIATHLRFLDVQENIVAFTLNGEAVGDAWKKILVIYNANTDYKGITIPRLNWKQHQLPGREPAIIGNGIISVPAQSCTVLYVE
jgi:pullulanase